MTIEREHSCTTSRRTSSWILSTGGHSAHFYEAYTLPRSINVWNTSVWQRQRGSHLCMWASWTHVHSSRSWNLARWSNRQLKMEFQRVCQSRKITRWRRQCEVDILPVDCLLVTPPLVGPILSGKASTCHVVEMGQRVCRKRLLVHMAPTRGTRFRESSLQQQRSRRTASRVRGCNWRSMHDSRIVNDLLVATEHVKNTNQASLIARAFARVFAKHWQCDVSEVTGSIRRVHFETLRRARIRLDAVASMLWRKWW